MLLTRVPNAAILHCNGCAAERCTPSARDSTLLLPIMRGHTDHAATLTCRQARQARRHVQVGGHPASLNGIHLPHQTQEVATATRNQIRHPHGYMIHFITWEMDEVLGYRGAAALSRQRFVMRLHAAGPPAVGTAGANSQSRRHRKVASAAGAVALGDGLRVHVHSVGRVPACCTQPQQSLRTETCSTLPHAICCSREPPEQTCRLDKQPSLLSSLFPCPHGRRERRTLDPCA